MLELQVPCRSSRLGLVAPEFGTPVVTECLTLFEVEKVKKLKPWQGLLSPWSIQMPLRSST